MIDLRYRLNKWGANFAQWLAHRLPRWLKYFVVIDCWAAVTCGKYSNTCATNITVPEMLNRMNYE